MCDKEEKEIGFSYSAEAKSNFQSDAFLNLRKTFQTQMKKKFGDQIGIFAKNDW